MSNACVNTSGLEFEKFVTIFRRDNGFENRIPQTTISRAAGSRKRLYLRRRYILEGRKNPMLSVISYICVGYHPGGCRFSKWCKFFLEPKR